MNPKAPPNSVGLLFALISGAGAVRFVFLQSMSDDRSSFLPCSMELSIVIAVYNEQEVLAELAEMRRQLDP